MHRTFQDFFRRLPLPPRSAAAAMKAEMFQCVRSPVPLKQPDNNDDVVGFLWADFMGFKSDLPPGKLSHGDGKSQCSMGKSTMNGNFQ